MANSRANSKWPVIFIIITIIHHISSARSLTSTIRRSLAMDSFFSEMSIFLLLLRLKHLVSARFRFIENLRRVADTSPNLAVCETSTKRTKYIYIDVNIIVHYDTSAMKRFLTSVSLQHEPKASDVITLVKKTFFRTSIVRNFISRGVKMRISVRKTAFTHSEWYKYILYAYRRFQKLKNLAKYRQPFAAGIANVTVWLSHVYVFAVNTNFGCAHLCARAPVWGCANLTKWPRCHFSVTYNINSRGGEIIHML